MKAIVNTMICPLYSRPDRASSLADEVLYGMVVELLEAVAPGWYRVRSHYRYEGFAPAEFLLPEGAEIWEAQPKYMVFHKTHCDVLSKPDVQGAILQTLPMGGLVTPAGEAENGWQKVLLADGEEGYVPAAVLVPQPTEPVAEEESALRQALVDAAMRYRGTPYRWGGKTAQGIDCSGLCSMAYMLCGILIYRDADIMEGFPLREIPMEQMGPGDLIFFPGHVAMYLGEGRYCHSTGKAGSNGFAINSLDPEHPDYREDLHRSITRIGSVF